MSSITTTADDNLLSPLPSFSLLEAFLSLKGLGPRLTGLELAISTFTDYVKDDLAVPDWDFYRDLLPQMQVWASSVQYVGKAVGSLTVHETKSVSLSEGFVTHILANAFFGYLGRQSRTIEYKFGTLHFWKLCIPWNQFPRYLLCCMQGSLIPEIQLMTKNTPFSTTQITFQRVSLASTPPPDWQAVHQPICTDRICILLVNAKQNFFMESECGSVQFMNDRMESATSANAFVDFANRDLHIHQVIASATQEEVLFSCCPEAFPGILFCERMADDEAIIIKGCRRFCDYTDIIAIDAVYSSHFRETQTIRDLNKAYLGFSQCSGNANKISTGYWGCGAFGGDKVHKFLQQICAATLTNTHIYFAAYQDQATLHQLEHILQELKDTSATVSEIFNITISFPNNTSFYTYLTAALAQLKLQRAINKN